jgi:hypothetical protein
VLARPIERKKARGEQLAKAKELHREAFDTLSGSRKERRVMLLKTLADLFSPLAKHIVRKREVLEKVRKDALRHGELVRQLAACTDMVQEKLLLGEMEALEEDDGYCAFASMPEKQHDMLLASSYSDLWTEVRDGAGRLVGGIASWYICLAKTAYGPPPSWAPQSCLRCTPSKDWGRRHADPMACKQRYYCGCNSRYNASWGQIVEISRLNKATQQVDRCYVRADVPSWDIEDIRGMFLEEQHPDVASAADLYSRIRRVEPATSDVIVESAGGFKKIASPETWAAIPTFRWVEIFNLAGVEAPPAVVKGK